MSDLSFDDKIDACKEFLNNFGRVPKYREITMIKGKLFRIGQFVHCAKKGYYNSKINIYNYWMNQIINFIIIFKVMIIMSTENSNALIYSIRAY